MSEALKGFIEVVGKLGDDSVVVVVDLHTYTERERVGVSRQCEALSASDQKKIEVVGW